MGISWTPDGFLMWMIPKFWAPTKEAGDEHDAAYERGGTKEDKWAADKGLTALDQVVFLLRKGGNSGKIRAVRLINKLCGVKI